MLGRVGEVLPQGSGHITLPICAAKTTLTISLCREGVQPQAGELAPQLDTLTSAPEASTTCSSPVRLPHTEAEPRPATAGTPTATAGPPVTPAEAAVATTGQKGATAVPPPTTAGQDGSDAATAVPPSATAVAPKGSGGRDSAFGYIPAARPSDEAFVSPSVANVSSISACPTLKPATPHFNPTCSMLALSCSLHKGAALPFFRFTQCDCFKVSHFWQLPIRTYSPAAH